MLDPRHSGGFIRSEMSGHHVTETGRSDQEVLDCNRCEAVLQSRTLQDRFGSISLIDQCALLVFIRTAADGSDRSRVCWQHRTDRPLALLVPEPSRDQDYRALFNNLFLIANIKSFVSVIADLTAIVTCCILSVIADTKRIKSTFKNMKRDETPLLTPARVQEAQALGAKLARLRMARHLRQADAAVRAGLARSTAVLIEKGDLSRTQAQILRYLEAIAPGLTLLSLLQESDPALKALSARERTQRVRPLSKSELAKLDF